MTELLIEELTPQAAGIIQESSNDGKNMWLNGIFMMAEQKNRNGRVYPFNEISAAVTSMTQKIAESKGILGELDHPNSLQIGLDRVSHKITEVRMEGNNAVGKMQLLDTPMGNIAKAIIQSGVAIGVSSRGAGNVNESGQVSGFTAVTVDIVATPSAQNAYPTSVYESLMHARNGSEIMSLQEAMKHDPAAQKYFKTEILKWLNTTNFARSK